MQSFEIDPKLLKSVTVVKNVHIGYDDQLSPDLAMLFKGEHNVTMTSSEDTDEFTALRKELGQLGYIQVQRGWVNGDYVLKPFTLNGKLFRREDQFPCAAALGIQFKIREFGFESDA